MPPPRETQLGMASTPSSPEGKPQPVKRGKTRNRVPDQEKEELSDSGAPGATPAMTLDSQDLKIRKKREWRNSKKYSVAGREGMADDGEAPIQGGDLSDNVVADIARHLQQIQEWTTKQDKVADQLLKKQVRMETMMQMLVQGQADPISFTAEDLRKAPTLGQLPSLDGKQGDARQQGEFSDIGEEDIEADSETKSTVALTSDHRMHTSQIAVRESEKSIGRLHSVFVQAIWNLPGSGGEPHIDHRKWHWAKFEHIVEHWAFEWVSAVVILAHSIFIGAYVEYLATADHNGHTVFSIGNAFFVVVFCVEVILKLGAERQEFFQGAEYRWNIFDIVLLALVLIEVPVGIVLSGKDKSQKKKMKTVLKIAEMVRTARILRIFRFLKFSRTLRVILAKILTSMQALGWIMVLVCIQLYVCAVCLTQGSNDMLAGNQQDPSYVMSEEESQVHRRVGSIPKSVYTLFASISGGILWGEAADVIMATGWFYVAVMVAFICFSIFAVLNVMTGIFVDDTIRADADLVLEHEAKMRSEQAAHLRKMFKHMDCTKDGAITLKEFQTFAHDDALKVYLDALGIQPDEAGTLFQLLDEDGSGEVLIDEFINGCMHLRGEASSLDMKTLLYENRRMRHKVFSFIHYTEDEYQKLFVAMGQMQKELRVMHDFYNRIARCAKTGRPLFINGAPDMGGTPQGVPQGGTGSSEGADNGTGWRKKKKKQPDIGPVPERF